ncbi:MAG: sulfurtransferase [Propionicimonas sp.]|nr:sulfurtransferase [Propionicimonas sp.]
MRQEEQATAGGTDTTGHPARARVLIGVAELADRLAGPEAPQLLDVRWSLGAPDGAGRGDYRAGHLPGARFLDLEAVLTGPTTDPLLGRHPLPDPDRVADGLAALGVDADRPVVVYDQPGSFAAGRAWWVLSWLGVDVRVLDGGLRAWVASAGPLETGEPRPPVPAQVRPLAPGHLGTIDADQAAGFDGTLIDVRAPERFRGEVEPLDPRAGHIPGAVNRPVGRFWDDDGRLPPAAVLRDLLRLPDDGRVAVYCGSGVSAAQVVLALASLGLDAELYPASWSGWSSDPDRPAAVGQ